MLRHKNIDRICAIALAATLLLTCAFMGAASLGWVAAADGIGYEDRLFDQSRVHTIDIVMDDWDSFIEGCASEEYASCTVVIDGEKYSNVAIRAKGNTSLSSVAAYGNNRYSFKIEFDHYQTGKTYYGLDKLCLNNLIQDKTYMKDYLSYTLMARMGVSSPLCSFVQINVNGSAWGLYLAVEGIEDSFLMRNYGKNSGELYKPDSMSFGGGRGNGADFDMDDFREKFENSDSDSTGNSSFTPPDMGDMTPPGGFGGDGSSTPPDMNGSVQADGDSSSDSQTDDSNADSTASTDDSSTRTAPDFSSTTPPDGMGGGGGGGKGGDMGGGMGSDDVKLQYIDDDPDSYSNIFDNAKADITDADKERLVASLKTLSEGEDVESVVDVDKVIRYFVVHNFLCNGDSYTGSMVHNYYLYEKDGVLSMIPWDYNLAFGAFSSGMGGTGDAAGEVNSPIDSPVSSGDIESRPMAAWIFASEEYTELYHEIYAEFIESTFTSGWFEEEIERVTQMIAPYVEKDENGFFSYDEFVTGAAALKQFCLKRAESITGQLDGTIPSTSDGQSVDSSALIDASDINLDDMGEFSGGGGGGNRGGDMPALGGGGRQGFPGGGQMGFPGAAGGLESDDSTDDGAMQDVNVPADGVNADAATNTSNQDSAAEQSENAQTDNASAPADNAMPATPQGGDMPNQPPHDLLGASDGEAASDATATDETDNIQAVEATDAPAPDASSAAESNNEQTDNAEVTASNDFNRGVPGDMLSNIGGFPGGGSASGNDYTYQIVLFAGSVLVLIAGLIFAWKFKSNL